MQRRSAMAASQFNMAAALKVHAARRADVARLVGTYTYTVPILQYNYGFTV